MRTPVTSLDTTRTQLQSLLRRFHACSEAVDWAAEKTVEDAWLTCERGDWLLWFGAKIEVERKLVVAAACDCAERALRFVPASEQRPAEAIATARRWIAGQASLDEVLEAADAACVAAWAAKAASPASAASAAAWAAADAAVRAVIYAADAAADATRAVADAGEATKRAELSALAHIVRARIPWALVERAIAAFSGDYADRTCRSG